MIYLPDDWYWHPRFVELSERAPSGVQLYLGLQSYVALYGKDWSLEIPPSGVHSVVRIAKELRTTIEDLVLLLDTLVELEFIGYEPKQGSGAWCGKLTLLKARKHSEQTEKTKKTDRSERRVNFKTVSQEADKPSESSEELSQKRDTQFTKFPQSAQITQCHKTQTQTQTQDGDQAEKTENANDEVEFSNDPWAIPFDDLEVGTDLVHWMERICTKAGTPRSIRVQGESKWKLPAVRNRWGEEIFRRAWVSFVDASSWRLRSSTGITRPLPYFLSHADLYCQEIKRLQFEPRETPPKVERKAEQEPQRGVPGSILKGVPEGWIEVEGCPGLYTPPSSAGLVCGVDENFHSGRPTLGETMRILGWNDENQGKDEGDAEKKS